jgi:hypothetical protein
MTSVLSSRKNTTNELTEMIFEESTLAAPCLSITSERLYSDIEETPVKIKL